MGNKLKYENRENKNGKSYIYDTVNFLKSKGHSKQHNTQHNIVGQVIVTSVGYNRFHFKNIISYISVLFSFEGEHLKSLSL